MVLFTVVVWPRPRNLFLYCLLAKPDFIILESCWWLKIFSFLFLSIFLLDLLYYIVIFKVLFCDLILYLLETSLPNTESRLFNYQIRVLLFLSNHFSRYVIIYQIVCARRGVQVYLNYAPSSSCWLEYRVRCLLIDDEMRIVCPWTRLVICEELLFFASGPSRTELSSVTSLDFIDQFILHSISWFISSRSRNNFRNLNINKTWESCLVFVKFYSFSPKLSRLYLLVILSWS